MKTIILVFVLFFCFQSSYCQENNLGYERYGSSIFDSKQKTLHVVSKLNEKIVESEKFIQFEKTVQIKQVGDFNNVHLDLAAKQIDVSLEQRGDSNNYQLNKKAVEIRQNIIQNGSDNNISDFTLSTRYKVNSQMIQNGDNQSITNIGTNSLSKNMKVSQTGNGAAVVIINK